MRVRLNVPESLRGKSPSLHGGHIAYHGQQGRIVAGAGNGGVFVQFDGMTGYIGCPVEWLERL